MPLNLIDMLLIALFIGTIALGFMGGTIRLLLVVIGIYLGVIIAGLFYLPMAVVVASGLPAINLYASQILSFFLLVSLGSAAFALALVKTLHGLTLPRFLASADQIGGAALGAIVATMSVFIFVIILRSIFGVTEIAHERGVTVWPVALALAYQLRASFMAGLFTDLAVPLLAVVSPWFPRGLPEIFLLR